MSDMNWFDNPALSGIDPTKLQMLLSLSEQAKGKSQADLLPFLMSATAQSGNRKINFSQEEMDAIIGVLKIGKSPQEIKRIDKMCSILRQFRR